MPRSPLPFLVMLLLGVTGLPAAAQPEIVPAEHPVYRLLEQQRVRGNLPEFRAEALPMGRRAVMDMLDSLETRRARTAGSTHPWLDRYRREFFEPDGAVETVFGDGPLRIPLGRDTEKYLFHYASEAWRVAISGRGRIQTRHVRGPAALSEQGSLDRTAPLGDGTLVSVSVTPEFALSGNYRNVVGFHSGVFNGVEFADPTALRGDPELVSLHFVAAHPAAPSRNFDQASASLRAGNRTFSAEVAQTRLRMGASFGTPLVLGGTSDHFSFVRLAAQGRIVQYDFIHAALGERSRAVRPDPNEGVILIAPDRWMAMHRLIVNPLAWLQLGLTEAVVYGLRGPELAYLNPAFSIVAAERSLWDRDNVLLAFEATVRPTRAVELRGTFLIDDMDYARIGQQSYNNKWAWQLGAGAALETPFGPALGYIEYTRIDPFVYTHRFIYEGAFYNAFMHNGYGIGHPIGPNADQLEIGLRTWVAERLRGEVRARYVRRGENFVDPETGDLVNVGGDIRDGRQPPFSQFTNVFLAGERLEGPGMTASLTWEPVRGLGLRGYLDLQRWDEAADRVFFRTELFVEF